METRERTSWNRTLGMAQVAVKECLKQDYLTQIQEQRRGARKRIGSFRIIPTNLIFFRPSCPRATQLELPASVEREDEINYLLCIGLASRFPEKKSKIISCEPLAAIHLARPGPGQPAKMALSESAADMPLLTPLFRVLFTLDSRIVCPLPDVPDVIS